MKKKYKKRLNRNTINELVKDIHSINDVIRWTVSKFCEKKIYYGHGTDNPFDEAIQLILPTLFLPINIPRCMQYAKLTYREKICIFNRVSKRINDHIPVSYLTNKSWFCGLEFYVDNRVLIPRSPIGELISEHFRNILPQSPQRILDMCTGSGCIAIACAYVYPQSKIDAVDISLDALSVAKKNIQLHNVENQITLIHSDLFNNIPITNYDLIIANPPYVKTCEINKLPKEFQIEPLMGLDGGYNGLKFIKIILSNAKKYLSKKGVLICEVGDHMDTLKKKYPKIKLNWINLNKGGNGIFSLIKNS